MSSESRVVISAICVAASLEFCGLSRKIGTKTYPYFFVSFCLKRLNTFYATNYGTKINDLIFSDAGSEVGFQGNLIRKLGGNFGVNSMKC